MPRKKEEAARDKLRSHFEANVGRILSTHELAKVAGIREYARRIRELRDQEGMQIRSHIDRQDLKPGEYILEGLERLPSIARDVSPQMRFQILERNGFTCQLCGAGPTDPDPNDPKRKTRLHIDHVIPLGQEGSSNDPSNLRTLCSACNQPRANVQTPSESAINLIARLRRAPRSVRREIFALLKKEFESGTTPKK